MKIYNYLIMFLLCISIVYAGETIKDIDTIAIDTRPTIDLIREDINLMPETEILNDNTALVETKDFKVSIDKFIAFSDELVNIAIDASETITQVCFDFPIDVKDIEITEIKEDVPYFIDTNIKTNEEKINNNKLCYNTDISNNNLYYKAIYHGKGSIKYNITINGIILDPYLIGDDLSTSTGGSNRLVIRLPFDGNSNAETINVPNSLPVSGLIYNESGYSMSHYIYTGDFSLGEATNPTYFIDNSWSTYARCSYNTGLTGSSGYCSDYTIIYKLATNTTGAIWQIKTDGSGSGTGSLSGTGIVNVTIADTCIQYAKNTNNNDIELRTRATLGGYATVTVEFQCYGYTSGWQTLHTASSSYYTCGSCDKQAVLDLYEEALWVTNSSNYTAYTSVTPKTQYYNTNGLVWSNSFRFWGNDSVNALYNDINTSEIATGKQVLYNDSGAYFNGTTSYINATFNTTGDFSNIQPFTIHTRFKSFGTDGYVFSKMNTAGTIGYDLRWRSSTGHAYFDYGYSANEGYVDCASASIDNNYHNVTIVVSNSSLRKIYIDGVYCAQNTTNVLTTIHNTQNFSIGRSNNNYFNGTIDDIRIFNRNLSQEEITILNNGGNFSTNILNENSKSLFLNGAESVRVQNITLPRGNVSKSVCLWVYYNQSTSNQISTMFGGSTPYWYLTHAANYLYGVQGGLTYYPAPTLNWAHECYTHDATSNSLSLYVNGALINTTYYSQSFLSSFLQIGAYSDFALPMLGGKVDEVNVYNYVLSQDEVSLLYGGFNNSLNIYIKEAITSELITQNVNIEISKLDLSYYKKKSTSTGKLYINGLGADTYKIFVTSQNYTPVTYYYTIPTNNEQYNLTIFMPTEASTEYKNVKLIVKDKSDDSILPNALIDIYALSNGNYTLVNQYYTNPNGDKTTSLVLNDVFYKFTVYYGSTKCYETVNPFTITVNDDTITLYCKLNSPFYDTTYAYKSINTTISFFNTSNETFYYSYQGTAGSGGNNYCWYLYQVDRTGDILLNSSCTVGQNVLLTTNIVNTSANTQDTTYYLKGCVTPANYNTPDCQFDYNTMKSGTGVDFTGIGLALTIGLCLVLFFAFIRIPQAAIVAVTLILCVASQLHFIKIPMFDNSTTAGTISILAIGMVLSFIISKRGSP